MKKKVLGKRTEREEEKEIKTVAGNTVRHMLQNAGRAKGSPWQMMKLAEAMQARAHNMVDIGYIRTLLYPELYNYDLPQPLSTQSYCRFTDKKDINIRSSMSQGSGATLSTASDCMIVWYPKTICGPQLFIRYGNLTTAKDFSFPAGPSNAPNSDINRWRVALNQDYTPYFSQANLVAASIQIQYIGQLQLEQGVIQCSQVYGVNPSNLTKDDIENGQFKCQSKPGDGLRAIYIPKDVTDFQYYPTVRPKGDAITLRTRNNGGKPEGDTVDLSSANFNLGSTFTNDTSYFLPPSGVSDVSWPGPTPNGSRPTLKYSLEGDAIVIYVMGMFTPSTEDLRIDVTRKFNGFPLAQHRDILDLTKPKKIFDPKKTIDVIQELQTAIPTLCCHKLSQMDRVSDQIQEFLPNVGHLYDEGMLKEGTNLDQFAGQLQQIAGTEGFPTEAPGRIYE